MLVDNVIFLVGTILIGFFVGKFRKINTKDLSFIITDILLPFLIIHSISNAQFDKQHIVTLAISVSFVIFGVYTLSVLINKINKNINKVYISIVFMNSGFLGITLCKLLWGDTGATYAIVYDLIVTVFIFTFGVYLVSGQNRHFTEIKRMYSSAVFYAVIIAVLLKVFKVELHQYISSTIKVLGDAVVPLSLLLLGFEFAKIRLAETYKEILLPSVLRPMLGGIVAVFVINMMNINGTLGKVILLISVLPSAIFSYILSARYNHNHENAAGVVLLSSIFSIIYLPVFIFTIN
jgi:malate permease and related proteins